MILAQNDLWRNIVGFRLDGVFGYDYRSCISDGIQDSIITAEIFRNIQTYGGALLLINCNGYIFRWDSSYIVMVAKL
jgi:hypothetical protein